MIDGDRIGAVAVEYMANNDDAAAIVEESPTYSETHPITNRYVSRKVTLNEKADDIVVTDDGSFVETRKLKFTSRHKVQINQSQSSMITHTKNSLRKCRNTNIWCLHWFSTKGSVGGVIRFTTDNTSPV